jgi:hypothetical protein
LSYPNVTPDTRERLLRQLEASEDGPQKPDNRWEGANPGDTICGRVVRVDWKKSKRGDGEFLVVDLESLDDGQVYSLPASRASLREKLLKVDVAVGDVVAVRYEGTYTSQYGTAGYGYQVVKDAADTF